MYNYTSVDISLKESRGKEDFTSSRGAKMLSLATCISYMTTVASVLFRRSQVVTGSVWEPEIASCVQMMACT